MPKVIWHRHRTTESWNRLWVVNGDSVTSCLISSLLSISCLQRKCPCCLNYKLVPGLWHLPQGRPPGRQDEVTYGGKRQTYCMMSSYSIGTTSGRARSWPFTTYSRAQTQRKQAVTSHIIARVVLHAQKSATEVVLSHITPFWRFLFIYPGLQGKSLAKLIIQNAL